MERGTALQQLLCYTGADQKNRKKSARQSGEVGPHKEKKEQHVVGRGLASSGNRGRSKQLKFND